MPKHVKSIIPHNKLYIASYTIDPTLPYLLFVHGGPGLNAGVIEYLLEHENLYDTLKANLIFYDQRGCGRSSVVSHNVMHADNIKDLGMVTNLITQQKILLKSIIGHSYGAKVVIDYLIDHSTDLSAIFIGASPHILQPRLNNLLLDLNYLKIEDPTRYA